MSRFKFAAAIGLLAAFACSDLKRADDVTAADAGSSTSSTSSGSSSSSGVVSSSSGGSSTSSSGGGNDGGSSDGGVGPSAPCRSIPLECLDPAPANVIEVIAESSLPDAFENAKVGDTVQVRNRTLGAGFRVPAGVTLRGCEGAKIGAGIAFAPGQGGTIEGFIVTGTIIVNEPGTFVVRHNQFQSSAQPDEFGVSARLTNGIVTGTINVRIEGNSFDTRGRGIEALTSYENGPRTIDITVRNNVFREVARPFYVGETGTSGIIKALVEHNTFFGFETAIQLVSLSTEATTRANIFMSGDKAIDGTPHSVEQSFMSLVTSTTPSSTGQIQAGDPAFVDPLNGDLRLGPSSIMIDRIAAGTPGPTTDYQGCPRPDAKSGKSDVGAYESQ